MSVTHGTTATGTDTGAGDIHKAEWNAAHTGTNDHGHTATADGGVLANVGILQSATATRTAGDLTTVSTTLVDLTGITVTLTTGAHRCLVFFRANGKISTITSTPDAIWTLLVDGVDQGGTLGLSFTGTAQPIPVGFFFLTAVLSAGSHTIKIQWRVDSATGTTYASSAITPASITVLETSLTV